MGFGIGNHQGAAGSPILMIVRITSRRASIHAHYPILAVIPVAVHAVVCDIPRRVIGVVRRALLIGHARDLIGWSAT